MSEKWQVRLHGGSIGEKRSSEGSLTGEHSDEISAKDHAKRMNKILSPGEKKYYGLKYKVHAPNYGEGHDMKIHGEGKEHGQE